MSISSPEISPGNKWLADSEELIKFGQDVKVLSTGKIELALIPGDGIGREVAIALLRVVHSINCRYEELVGLTLVPAGAELYQKIGIDMAEDGTQACKDADAILLGASGLPADGGQQLEMENGKFAGWTPLVGNRKNLDLYANVRPVKTFPGLKHRISGKYVENLWPSDLDLVLIRENTEDLYCGIGGIYSRSNTSELAVDVRLTTVKGVERISHTAFKLAKERQQQRKTLSAKVTCISKTNVLPGCKLFASTFESVAKQYPGIETEHMLVDAFSQSVIRKPEMFDVVVASNMFGDIVTEVASVVQGGMGMAAGCNIGDEHAMFEPIHGSAPNMAGKETCNPIAMFLAFAEALRWVGTKKNNAQAVCAAEDIESAVGSIILKGDTLTYDIKEQPAASTFDVAKAVAAILSEPL